MYDLEHCSGPRLNFVYEGGYVWHHKKKQLSQRILREKVQNRRFYENTFFSAIIMKIGLDFSMTYLARPASNGKNIITHKASRSRLCLLHANIVSLRRLHCHQYLSTVQAELSTIVALRPQERITLTQCLHAHGRLITDLHN